MLLFLIRIFNSQKFMRLLSITSGLFISLCLIVNMYSPKIPIKINNKDEFVNNPKAEPEFVVCEIENKGSKAEYSSL